MSVDRYIASTRGITLVMLALAGFVWTVSIALGAYTRTELAFRDAALVSWMSEQTLPDEDANQPVTLSGPFGQISVWGPAAREELFLYARAPRMITDEIDEHAERLSGYTYAWVVLPDDPDRALPFFGDLEVIRGLTPVRLDEADPEQVRTLAERLGVPVSSGDSIEDIVRRVDETQTIGLKLPVPGVDAGSIARVPLELMVWLAMVVMVWLTIAAGSRIRTALAGEESGGEPWLILDARSTGERVCGGLWGLAIAGAPFATGFAGIHAVASSFGPRGAVDEPLVISDLSVAGVVAPAATLVVAVFGMFKGLELLRLICRLRDERQRLRLEGA